LIWSLKSGESTSGLLVVFVLINFSSAIYFTMSKTEELILKNTNELLRSVGVASKKIVHFSELQKSASSMFVAIFETMFQVKLKGVIRKPSHVKDYEHNAQAVITALGKSILSMDLSHIR